MKINTEDEFYVGYKRNMPAALVKYFRFVLLILAVLIVSIMVLLVRAQRPFLPSMCEYNKVRSFEGIVIEKPYPLLAVRRPYAGEAQKYSLYYLVAEGKHGAQDLMKGLGGKNITLKGSLIYLDGQTMIEVLNKTIHAQTRKGEVSFTFKYLTQGKFVGEIVDSKCYLGAMNPANLKEHRSCAIRCISGGIPPLFIVQDKEGRKTYMILESLGGHSVNNEVLDMIGEPIEITGKVMRYENLLFLMSDPKTYRRIN